MVEGDCEGSAFWRFFTDYGECEGRASPWENHHPSGSYCPEVGECWIWVLCLILGLFFLLSFWTFFDDIWQNLLLQPRITDVRRSPVLRCEDHPHGFFFLFFSFSGADRWKKSISATLSSSLNVVGHKQKSPKSFSLQGELMGLLWNV